MVILYANILRYLAKAKHYFGESTGLRVLKSIFILEAKLESLLDKVSLVQASINDYAGLLDAETARNTAKDVAILGVNTRKTLMSLLREIYDPIYRMNDQLKGIEDYLYSHQRLEILTWVFPQPYKAHRNQNCRDILAGTRQWLLEDPVFME